MTTGRRHALHPGKRGFNPHPISGGFGKGMGRRELEQAAVD
jgi:hypothetical protein